MDDEPAQYRGLKEIQTLTGQSVQVTDGGKRVAEGVLQHVRREHASYRPSPSGGTWSGDVIVLVVGEETHEVSCDVVVELHREH